MYAFPHFGSLNEGFSQKHEISYRYSIFIVLYPSVLLQTTSPIIYHIDITKLIQPEKSLNYVKQFKVTGWNK